MICGGASGFLSGFLNEAAARTHRELDADLTPVGCPPALRETWTRGRT